MDMKTKWESVRAYTYEKENKVIPEGSPAGHVNDDPFAAGGEGTEGKCGSGKISMVSGW